MGVPRISLDAGCAIFFSVFFFRLPSVSPKFQVSRSSFRLIWSHLTWQLDNEGEIHEITLQHCIQKPVNVKIQPFDGFYDENLI